MKTVLLIEDNEDVREAIRMILEGDEFHLLEAGSGEEGLKLVPLADIIILDIRLPGINGGEFLERVYKSGEVKIPVIIFTGVMSREEAIERYAVKYPVVECFTKPGDPEELVRVLRQTNGVHLMKIDAATRVIKKFVEKQSITDTQWWKGNKP